MNIEWSDVLGNNATALEIVRSSGITNVSLLREWIAEQAADIGNPIDVWQADAVTHDLLDSAAHERVRTSDLVDYEDIIFYDWTEGDSHLLYIATEPEADVLSWARSIEAAR